MNNLALNFNPYQTHEGVYAMPKIEWLTLNAAAELDTCPVTGETLRQMILRGDVPDGHWMVVPYGTRKTYYIDPAILPELPYRDTGKRGKQKDK